MPPSNKNIKNMAARQERRERLLTAAMSLAAALLTFSFFFGEIGMAHYAKMKATQTQYQKDIHRLEQDNDALLNEITALKTDSLYLEQLARERLGYIKKGELSYEFYDP